MRRLAATRHVDHLFDNLDAAGSLVAELNGEIVGIADAEMCAVGEVEIAFLVADHAHGLGVGTLLLEHRAAMPTIWASRWFTAEVLATNASMLRVFHDAGFKVERKSEAGVVLSHMGTDADLGALAAADIRGGIAESRSLKPRSLQEALRLLERAEGLAASVAPSSTAFVTVDSGERSSPVHPQADKVDGFPSTRLF